MVITLRCTPDAVPAIRRETMMTHEYERALGARLRSTRMQRGLSLQDVQVQSDGRSATIECLPQELIVSAYSS